MGVILWSAPNDGRTSHKEWTQTGHKTSADEISTRGSRYLMALTADTKQWKVMTTLCVADTNRISNEDLKLLFCQNVTM